MMKPFTLLLVLLIGQAVYAGKGPTVIPHEKSSISWRSFSDAQEFINKVKTYPNPIADWVTIEFPPEVKKINVFSLIGSKVTEVNVTNEDRTQINFDGFPSGYYILLFTDEKGQTLGTKKVVKR